MKIPFERTFFESLDDFIEFMTINENKTINNIDGIAIKIDNTNKILASKEYLEVLKPSAIVNDKCIGIPKYLPVIYDEDLFETFAKISVPFTENSPCYYSVCLFRENNPMKIFDHIEKLHDINDKYTIDRLTVVEWYNIDNKIIMVGYIESI